MRQITLALCAALLASATSVAQPAPILSTFEPAVVKSGSWSNPGTQEVTVFQTLVQVAGKPWLRLRFDDINVPNGSYLHVISLLDGYDQVLDSAALAQWQNTSAYFNGDALYLLLVAGPGAQNVHVSMSMVEAGANTPPVGPSTICGTTDDRQLSTDARCARVLTVGCTAWLISSSNCLISAGHCCAGGTTVVQFNVPLSNSNGTINNPPPSDQYNVDPASRVFVNGGLGNDWCVFKTFVNSTTGQHAGQKQGAFFGLMNTRPSVNSTIRITGYGTASGVRNQVQQTHTGPLRTNSPALCYAADTTGGNSGSPVIDEASGLAAGVHTHGGCTSTGGCNSGTTLALTAFWNAVQAAGCGSAGSYATFGLGCAGIGIGVPVIASTGSPAIGQTYQVTLSSGRSGVPATLFVGASKTSWPPLALPFDLAPFGAFGCQVLSSGEVQLNTTVSGTGTASQSIMVPNLPILQGQQVHNQWFELYAPANTLGVVVSAGGTATIG